MKKYYLKDWHAGLAVDIRGNDFCLVLRFDSMQERQSYIDNYIPPSHCPCAFAEPVTRREIERSIRGKDWVASDCGKFHMAI